MNNSQGNQLTDFGLQLGGALSSNGGTAHWVINRPILEVNLVKHRQTKDEQLTKESTPILAFNLGEHRQAMAEQLTSKHNQYNTKRKGGLQAMDEQLTG